MQCSRSAIYIYLHFNVLDVTESDYRADESFDIHSEDGMCTAYLKIILFVFTSVCNAQAWIWSETSYS